MSTLQEHPPQPFRQPPHPAHLRPPTHLPQHPAGRPGEGIEQPPGAPPSSLAAGSPGSSAPQAAAVAAPRLFTPPQLAALKPAPTDSAEGPPVRRRSRLALQRRLRHSSPITDYRSECLELFCHRAKTGVRATGDPNSRKHSCTGFSAPSKPKWPSSTCMQL